MEKLFFKDFIKFFLFAILPFFTVISLTMYWALGTINKSLGDCGGLVKCIGKTSAKIEKDFNEGRGK